MSSSILAAGRALFAITPSDTVNFATRARAVYVGVGGNIAFVSEGGTVAIAIGVPQGTVFHTECVRINATGTTATSLLGLV